MRLRERLAHAILLGVLRSREHVLRVSPSHGVVCSSTDTVLPPSSPLFFCTVVAGSSAHTSRKNCQLSHPLSPFFFYTTTADSTSGSSSLV